MVSGGDGIRGLINEPVFNWLYSDEGLSELGIFKEDVDQLVEAHKRSYKVSTNANQLSLLFGDKEFLKASTPHPFDNIGKLAIGSWLIWVDEGQSVTDAGFVDRSSLPDHLEDYIRLPSPLGGLMLSRGQFGSRGTWKVPSEYNGYMDKWMAENSGRIKHLLTSQLISILNK